MNLFSRLTFKRQLLFVLVFPALLVLLGTTYFADKAMRSSLDRALAERLIGSAQVAGTIITPRVSLLEPGDEELRLTKRTQQKLLALLKAAELERIIVIKSDKKSVLIDSRKALKIGDTYPRAMFDSEELQRAMRGESIASVLFRGVEGRWYKSAYSPHGEDMIIAVHARATFFQTLDSTRNVLLAITITALILLVALAFASASRVTVPLQNLSSAAERIGRGYLEEEIPQKGPLEVRVLGQTMNQMAKSLHQRDEEMQMMLGGIAHEVRNPLGGIELFGSLLKEDLAGDDEKITHVDKILKEIKVLSKVVNDFLAFARTRGVNKTEVNLDAIFSEIQQISSVDAQAKDVKIILEVDKELHAQFDRPSIRSALLNLVRNAIQASPNDGVVTLNAQTQEKVLVITIRDQGPGVPPEKRDDIFAPFFTTKQKGTGLGLALVRKAVLEHQGEIEYRSNEPTGAIFIIRLPVNATYKPVEEPGLLD